MFPDLAALIPTSMMNALASGAIWEGSDGR